MKKINLSKKITLNSQIILLTLFCSLIYSPAKLIASQSKDSIWRNESLVSKTSNTQSAYKLIADTYALKRILSNAPDIKNRELGQVGAYLYLPLDDASFSLFEVFEKKPTSKPKKTYLKTYTAFGIDRPELIGHLDIGMRGFHAMIMGSGKPIYIDPDFMSFKNNKSLGIFQEDIPNQYQIFKRDHTHKFQCGFESFSRANNKNSSEISSNTLARQVGNELRTYRIAVTTSAAYATAVSIGETDQEKIDSTLAAIATAIARINVVYNQDLAIHLEPVLDEKLIILDPVTNPFSNNANEDIDIVTAEIDKVIPNDQYDIGHLFIVTPEGGDGLAFFRSVCHPENKGKGVTGLEADDLKSDAFYIDYVAHEIGHQFGANHTFNGTSSSCEGNRNSTTAFEPGSGSTIMAYAGICGSENLQTNSDPYFHAGSIDEILNFVANASTGGSCNASQSIVNNPPTVDAGSNYTIPANTPFKLSASGSDPEDDPITYTWEQMDTGASTNSPAQMQQDNGSRTLFRSFLGTSNPVRYLPNFDDLLNNTLGIGETYPSTTRKLNFRVTARSGSYGSDTNSETPVVIQTIGTGSSFSVIEPQKNSYHLKSSNMITLWDTANTQTDPINCNEVDILFSNSASPDYESFTALLNNTPNDGEQIVTLPAEISINARILIQCSDNIFYNINNGNFNIIDSNATLFSISIDAKTKNEGNSGSQTFLFKITRAGNLNLSSSIEYKVSGFGSTPSDEQDFTSDQALSATLNFGSGISEKILSIQTKGDLLLETNEQFKVVLSNPTNAFISTTTAIATIVNDDTAKKKSGGGGSFIFLQLIWLVSILFFKKNYLALLFITLSFSLAQCSQMPKDSETEQSFASAIQNNSESVNHPQILALLWVNNADPLNDAAKAIKNNELLFFANRSRGGLFIPGLNEEETKLALKQGYKTQEGMGDIIFNTEHQELRKKFMDYAARYNKVLFDYLMIH